MTHRSDKTQPTTLVISFSGPVLQRLITPTICHPRLIAQQTNAAKGETLSMMDSTVPNEMQLLRDEKAWLCIKVAINQVPQCQTGAFLILQTADPNQVHKRCLSMQRQREGSAHRSSKDL